MHIPVCRVGLNLKILILLDVEVGFLILFFFKKNGRYKLIMWRDFASCTHLFGSLPFLTMPKKLAMLMD